jgi:OFA family oxalate/formate antiporter-like MFS transporter
VLLGLCLAVFAYAGFLALMPAFTADYFGPAHVGANYGILFTAWGVSGFAAPGYFERVLEHAGYSEVYLELAVISALAIGVVTLLQPVDSRKEEA